MPFTQDQINVLIAGFKAAYRDIAVNIELGPQAYAGLDAAVAHVAAQIAAVNGADGPNAFDPCAFIAACEPLGPVFTLED